RHRPHRHVNKCHGSATAGRATRGSGLTVAGMKPIQLRVALTAAAISLLAPCLMLPAEAPAAAAGWRWPVDGPVITQYRNGDDPYAGGQHRGIDIAAPVGTPVVAAIGGAITYAGVAGSSGLTVAVQTSD